MIGDILQPTHLLFILVIALLVLGPKRLPEVARSLGSGLRDFRSAISGESRDDDSGRSGGFQLFEENGQRSSEAEHSYTIAQGTTHDDPTSSQSGLEPQATPPDASPAAPAPPDASPAAPAPPDASPAAPADPGLGDSAPHSEPMSQPAFPADTTPAHAAAAERSGSALPDET